MFSTFASNIPTILEVSHETQQNQNSYEWSERMPSLEKKYGAAPSTTYSGGIALRGFCVGLDGGLFHSFDPAEGTNSIGLYGSLQHSANIPASALLFQDKSLSEFTMGDFGTIGGAFTSLTSVGAGLSFGVQSWAPAAGYQMGFATGPEAIFAGRWRETAFQGREVKVRKLGNGSRSSVATLASATAN